MEIENSSEELYIREGLIKMIRGGLMNPIRVGLHKTTPALISDHLLRRVKVLSTDELHQYLIGEKRSIMNVDESVYFER